MNNFKDRVKNAIDIIEIAAEYGFEEYFNGVGYCIFCKYKKKRSMYVDREFQYYVCHHSSCNSRGDVFSMVMEMESIGFKETIEKLAFRANIELK